MRSSIVAPMHRWLDRRRYVPSQMKARCASQPWSTALQGEVAGMLAEYGAARKTLAILQQPHLPKSELVVRSSLSALETGQADAFKVLDAIRRLRGVQLEILKLRVQLQATLAEIEKAGGEGL